MKKLEEYTKEELNDFLDNHIRIPQKLIIQIAISESPHENDPVYGDFITDGGNRFFWRRSLLIDKYGKHDVVDFTINPED
jgi:glycosyltransferase involved in cell wall biosynthesis